VLTTYWDIRVSTYSDPKEFLVRAERFLESDPFSPSVIATVATRSASGALAVGTDHAWLVVEENNSRVIGLAMHTPPHNMFLSQMPEDAALVLAKEVADSGRNLPGVNGAIVSTRPLARAWEEVTGRPSTLLRATRMYRLVELHPPEAVTGQAVRAVASQDLGLVAEWLAAFHDEAQPHAPVDDWTATAQRRINAAEFHLWLADGVPGPLRGSPGQLRESHELDPCIRHQGGAATDTAAVSRRQPPLRLSARVHCTLFFTPTWEIRPRTRSIRTSATNLTTTPKRGLSITSRARGVPGWRVP
jgi:hypothetical protein